MCLRLPALSLCRRCHRDCILVHPEYKSQDKVPAPTLPRGDGRIVQCYKEVACCTLARELSFLNAVKEGKRSMRIGRIAMQQSSFKTNRRLRRLLRYTLSSTPLLHIVACSQPTGGLRLSQISGYRSHTLP